MTNKAHASLTGSDLHESKGVASATAGQVYITDGAGSGVWTDTGATIGSTNFTTGDLKSTIKTTADSGWVMCNDGTIGDLSSGATTLASSTTSALFTLLWTNFANTECAVSGGRGVSAAADYAAHKTIALPKMLGRVYGIAGAGSGLTSRTIGVAVGEENHTISTAELPVVTPSGTVSVALTCIGATPLGIPAGTSSVIGALGSGFNTYTTGNFNPLTVSSATFTGNSLGSGSSHNTMQPTIFLKMMIKL